MTQTQHLAVHLSPTETVDDSATLCADPTPGQYFFEQGTDSLQRGYVSVTPIVCESGMGINLVSDSWNKDRRLRCPRASKHSQPSASWPSSQHVAASKKKKLLLLSRSSKSRPTASSKTFAGRASCCAPQNPGRPAAIDAADDTKSLRQIGVTTAHIGAPVEVRPC